MSRLLVLDSAWRELDDQTFFRAPFQGAVMMVVNPGLKPWAMLFCHFVACIAYAVTALTSHSRR